MLLIFLMVYLRRSESELLRSRNSLKQMAEAEDVHVGAPWEDHGVPAALGGRGRVGLGTEASIR